LDYGGKLLVDEHKGREGGKEEGKHGPLPQGSRLPRRRFGRTPTTPFPFTTNDRHDAQRERSEIKRKGEERGKKKPISGAAKKTIRIDPNRWISHNPDCSPMWLATHRGKGRGKEERSNAKEGGSFLLQGRPDSVRRVAPRAVVKESRQQRPFWHQGPPPPICLHQYAAGQREGRGKKRKKKKKKRSPLTGGERRFRSSKAFYEIISPSSRMWRLYIAFKKKKEKGGKKKKERRPRGQARETLILCRQPRTPCDRRGPTTAVALEEGGKGGERRSIVQYGGESCSIRGRMVFLLARHPYSYFQLS